MGEKFLFKILILMGIIVLIIPYVLAIQGSSSSYTTDSKFDSVASGPAINSTSFSQRFVGGGQAIFNTSSTNTLGRLGLPIELQTLINFTSHNQSSIFEVSRGNDAIAGEDDLGLVSNTINFSGRLLENITFFAIGNGNCSFSRNDTFIGSGITNSTGDCILNYDKTGLSVGFYFIGLNYTLNESEGLINVTNFSMNLVRYNIANAVTHTFGGNFINGSYAALVFNITKINNSGSVFYDPYNVSVNATTSAGTQYPESAYVSGYRLNKNSAGQYEVRVNPNMSLGTLLKWNMYFSDDNFSNYIASAVHSDTAITNAVCGNSVIEPGEQCDGGSSCSASCTTVSGGTTSSCFPENTSITMADESIKMIQDVKVGDRVLSYDIENNKIIGSYVLELENPIREGYYDVGGIVNITDEHPLYTLKNDGRVGWAAIDSKKSRDDLKNSELNGKDIYDLEIGDKLFRENREWVKVEYIRYVPGEIKTYNLKNVDNYNNFFADGVLAHNKGGGTTGGCNPNWVCSEWNICTGGIQTRVCDDVNSCGTIIGKPSQSQSCGQWICGDWGICGPVNGYTGPLPAKVILSLASSISIVLEGGLNI